MPQATQDRAQLIALIKSLIDDIDGTWVMSQPKLNPEDPTPELLVEMTLGETEFNFYHDLKEPHLVSLECRFGAFPDENPVEAMKKMLEMNGDIAPIGRQGFHMDAATKDAVFSESLVIQETNVKQLRLTIDARIELAKTWRENRWTDPGFLGIANEKFPRNAKEAQTLSNGRMSWKS